MSVGKNKKLSKGRKGGKKKMCVGLPRAGAACVRVHTARQRLSTCFVGAVDNYPL